MFLTVNSSLWVLLSNVKKAEFEDFGSTKSFITFSWWLPESSFTKDISYVTSCTVERTYIEYTLEKPVA